MDKLNIQLFSVKYALHNDFDGTLESLSKMGYEGVEFFGGYGGYGGYNPDELQKRLDYYGLSAVSAHVPIDEIENDDKFAMHAAMLQKCGCMYIMNPWVELNSEDEALRFGERLEKAAEKCAKAGFLYGHHTHGGELAAKDENGNSYFDLMMSQAELCLVEFDTFWLEHAGANIEEYLRKYAGKINLLHLKQMNNAEQKQVSPLNNGIIDFEPIVKTAKKFGTETFIYELDKSDDELGDAMASIEWFRANKL